MEKAIHYGSGKEVPADSMPRSSDMMPSDLLEKLKSEVARLRSSTDTEKFDQRFRFLVPNGWDHLNRLQGAVVYRALKREFGA